MVKQIEPATDHGFAALADPTRRAIVARLTQGQATVSELAGPHAMTLPAVMKHLDILGAAGLVHRRKQGRVVTCTLDAGPLEEARAWLDVHVRFWNERLDALGRILDETEEKPR
jgi:DNA-binding transcriptional ArsR family regulator